MSKMTKAPEFVKLTNFVTLYSIDNNEIAEMYKLPYTTYYKQINTETDPIPKDIKVQKVIIDERQFESKDMKNKEETFIDSEHISPALIIPPKIVTSSLLSNQKRKLDDNIDSSSLTESNKKRKIIPRTIFPGLVFDAQSALQTKQKDDSDSDYEEPRSRNKENKFNKILSGAIEKRYTYTIDNNHKANLVLFNSKWYISLEELKNLVGYKITQTHIYEYYSESKLIESKNIIKCYKNENMSGGGMLLICIDILSKCVPRKQTIVQMEEMCKHMQEK